MVCCFPMAFEELVKDSWVQALLILSWDHTKLLEWVKDRKFLLVRSNLLASSDDKFAGATSNRINQSINWMNQDIFMNTAKKNTTVVVEDLESKFAGGFALIAINWASFWSSLWVMMAWGLTRYLSNVFIVKIIQDRHALERLPL